MLKSLRVVINDCSTLQAAPARNTLVTSLSMPYLCWPNRSGTAGCIGYWAESMLAEPLGVAVHLRSMVHVHNRDQHGNIAGPPVISRGLVNRRAEEIAQHNTPIAPPVSRRR